MTSDAKIKELGKKLNKGLVYSDELPEKQTVKTDFEQLKKLAKKFSKNLEDYTVETVVYTVSTKTAK